jgi:NADPH:quinone reductase-like Zn-dependent oxidoreductase
VDAAVKAAVLHEHGAAPRFEDFDDPAPGDGSVVVAVEAAGVNHLDLLKASGRFYTGPPPLPSVVGSDAVGRLDDGRRVFFDATVAPHGAMAERTLVPEGVLIDVRDDLDATVAAAIGNAGLSAWLALVWRATLQPGDTVLVLGATGALGRAAVQVARAQGAGRVVAAARDRERLEQVAADATVVLDADEDDLATAMRDACDGGADVIIDPLWGAPALAAMRAARHGARHVQLGHMAAPSVDVGAMVVRSPMLTLMGMAIFHAPIDLRREAYASVAELAAQGELELDLRPFPLAEVAEAWEHQRQGPREKLVIVP